MAEPKVAKVTAQSENTRCYAQRQRRRTQRHNNSALSLGSQCCWHQHRSGRTERWRTDRSATAQSTHCGAEERMSARAQRRERVLHPTACVACVNRANHQCGQTRNDCSRFWHDYRWRLSRRSTTKGSQRSPLRCWRSTKRMSSGRCDSLLLIAATTSTVRALRRFHRLFNSRLIGQPVRARGCPFWVFEYCSS